MCVDGRLLLAPKGFLEGLFWDSTMSLQKMQSLLFVLVMVISFSSRLLVFCLGIILFRDLLCYTCISRA